MIAGANRSLEPATTSFLSLASHEIESLTNAILLASQTLSEITNNPDTKNHHQVRELVQLIHCSSLSIAPLIKELVTIGKFHSGCKKVNLGVVFSFPQELEYIRDTFSYEAAAKNIEISISAPKDFPVLFCDISSLRTCVFNNLLSNALHHTPIGGKIAICAEIKDSQILIIKISDTGLGISISERETLFQKQPRLDNFWKNVSGLGLYNARQCIHAHNGTISIIDNPCFTGATFKIEIPLYAECKSLSVLAEVFTQK